VTTVRAVGITEPGGVEVLGVIEHDVREPGEGEVRIVVTAAPVHPSDIAFRERGMGDLPPPWVPGWDAGGTVESVGPGVDGFVPGDRVMAVVLPRRPDGGVQSELVVVPAASVVPAPEGASLEQASTLPMNGLTAFVGLELLGVGEGDTLVVTGGAGLLASFVIPIAKGRGIRVLADAKPADEALVRSFGADVVLPRGDDLVDEVRAQVPAGVDAVYDTALLQRAMLPAIREGGGLAVVRGWDGEDIEQGVHIHRVWVGDVLDRADWLRKLGELAGSGAIQLRVASTYPPERAADAHQVMDAGGLRGRAVIVFD
jgi:NADPH:quinone reductase-like Zn-dependent oxidoreductase